MATVLFIHGTGVRHGAYETAHELVYEGLNAALTEIKHPGVRLEKCLWGDTYGTRLNAGGASIPDYDHTGGARPWDWRDPDGRILLWGMLAYSPLYELHGMAMGRKLNRVDQVEFTARVGALPVSEVGEAETRALIEALAKAGLTQAFPAARDRVVAANDFKAAVLTAADESDLYRPVARALVSEAVSRSGDDPAPAVRFSSRLRDATVDALSAALGEPTKGIFSWSANKLFTLAQQLHIVDLCYRRGQLTDGVAPLAGDVVMYQSRGDEIRDFIRDKIERALAIDPPVVLLAHSLGGIACVDLLATDKPAPPPVHALVTVGSQAPFLYEINALESLRYNEDLPTSFPKWLNIYDRRDLLSYVAAKVFRLNGRPADAVCDVEVDNGLPFPEAHSGYWANPETWKLVRSMLP